MPESYIPPGSTTQAPLSPEEEARRRAALAASGDPVRQGVAADAGGNTVVKSTGPVANANWDVTDATRNTIDAEQARIAQIEKTQADRAAAGLSPIMTIDEAMDKNDAKLAQANAVTGEQASRGGVEVGDAVAAAGGIDGFFGGKQVVKHYTAGNNTDTTTAGNKATLAERIAGIDSRENQTMQAAQVGPMAQAQAAQLGPMAQAQAAQLGPGAQAVAAQTATGPQDQFRAQQMNLAQQLGASAAGQGPSAAQAQLKLATDRNMSQSLALALGARGGNQAGAMKQAQMQRALIGQEASGQSAALAAQEQQAAQQSLGQLLGSGRGADIGLAQGQAGLNQQTALANQQSVIRQGELNQQTALANQAATNTGLLSQNANDQQVALANQAATNAGISQQAGMDQQTNAANLQAGIDQQKQKDAMVQAYLAQGMTLDQAQRQTEIQQAQFNAELLARQAAADQGVAMQSSAAAGQTAASAIGAVASGIAMAASDRRAKTKIASGRKSLGELLSGFSTSDERAKTDIKPGKQSLGELLSGVGVHEYEYKDPGKPMRGEGRFVSPMAQELEKTKIGKSMVSTSKDGTKVVDYGKGLGAMLSAMSWLHERVGKMEAAR
jgi:hypothetical protein